MANPRNVVDFTDIDARRETYKVDNSTIKYAANIAGGGVDTTGLISVIGLAVMLSTDDTVALTQDASKVLGKLLKVESDLKCTVQTRGMTKLPSGAGATLTVGGAIVGDLDGSDRGYVRLAAAATLAEVAVQRGTIINNDDTANVVVLLD